MGADIVAAPLQAGTYLHWGVVHISLTNFLIIAAMVVVFVLALLLPFGRASARREPGPRTPTDGPRP